MLHAKTVYLNDVPIGHASTWAEVYALLREQHVHFVGKPGTAEGPTAFYVHVPLVSQRAKATEIGEAG